MDKGASFIKVLGHDCSKQLEIPHDFTKTFKGHVLRRVFIESSVTKKCWRVEVEEDRDGTTYLRDGWTAFAEAHYLEAGNFLLFECEEQSIFQVKIYAQNGCQKSMFVNSSESQPSLPKVSDTEEERKGETFESESKISTESRQQRTRTLPERNYNTEIYKTRHAVFKTYRKSANVGENRMSFSVSLAKKHQLSQLTVPMAVGLENKLASKDQVVLRDVEGNYWPIRLGHKKDGHALLLRGWKQFLDGNNIAIGDILKFEFVSDKLAQVHVTRSSEPEEHLHEAKCDNKDTESFHVDGESGMAQGSYATNDQTGVDSIATKRADSAARCSSFSFSWSKSRALTSLYIPKAIAVEQKLMNQQRVVLRDTYGKCWPLEVKAWRDGRVGLTKGWCELWKGLPIRHGDTLKFEFISNSLVQVSIHKREQPHKINSEEATFDMETMDTKGSAGDLLASPQEHSSHQAPPGFKPMEKHVMRPFAST